MNHEKRLQERLAAYAKRGMQRSLRYRPELISFSSNDYLGLARNRELLLQLGQEKYEQMGATGSRLLSGHHPAMLELEQQLAQFHDAEAALLFNTGYLGNLGLVSALLQRGDTLYYDALAHASLHDALKLAKGQAFAFAHNDLQDLEGQLALAPKGLRYIWVESLYSMDGDQAPLRALADLAERYGAALLVDEAHATACFGPNGGGLVQELGLSQRIFARLHTFGKAVGSHGAVILGSSTLRQYLINFARPLIYSTAMSLPQIGHLRLVYRYLEREGERLRAELGQRLAHYLALREKLALSAILTANEGPIQAIFWPGNRAVLALSEYLEGEGFDLRPIRYPTVPRGEERLRICLRADMDLGDISALLEALAAYLGR
ncbi:7-keto-8-aminopelargonate synthetase-like enzyme [Saprospira grandis DSM 2844]|uniref:7-keto-8-aminopelargonate synthetase-like enzyme n=1 Tax=Saprospira grandis DSM 2844 TaxID=694433 RepID=J1I1F6_9BACT|nr:8-amino-7-oxononanoate synthase [Saprospira grandis]EJF52520.1 7-keto-8-aminopelargonate synthetase-like enzyme [Saprospira grandis DSM 2844]